MVSLYFCSPILIFTLLDYNLCNWSRRKRPESDHFAHTENRPIHLHKGVGYFRLDRSERNHHAFCNTGTSLRFSVHHLL
jgi:hypothetical protein